MIASMPAPGSGCCWPYPSSPHRSGLRGSDARSLAAGMPADPAALDRGRGLYIVQAVASARHTVRIPAGKIVWALFRTDSHRADSPAPEDPDRQDVVAVLAAGTASAGQYLPRTRGSPTGRRELLRYLPTMLTSDEIAAEIRVFGQRGRGTHAIHLSQARRIPAQRCRFVAYERGMLP